MPVCGVQSATCGNGNDLLGKAGAVRMLRRMATAGRAALSANAKPKNEMVKGFRKTGDSCPGRE